MLYIYIYIIILIKLHETIMIHYNLLSSSFILIIVQATVVIISEMIYKISHLTVDFSEELTLIKL